MFQETKRNTNDVEKGEAWGKYAVFYATSIDQKIREKQEKIREEKIGKGKGSGKTKHKPAPPWEAPDYEHRGVGIAIHRKHLNCLKEVRPINGRLISLTLNSKGNNINFISAYAPTAQSSMETKDTFYEELNDLINELKGEIIIGGDMNAQQT